MLATVVCAVLCGARGFEAIAQWIHLQPKELWYLLRYFRTPPTGGAFRYLLSKLDPAVLEQVLRDWMAPERTTKRDGKTTTEVQCDITSLSRQRGGCRKAIEGVAQSLGHRESTALRARYPVARRPLPHQESTRWTQHGLLPKRCEQFTTSRQNA